MVKLSNKKSLIQLGPYPATENPCDLGPCFVVSKVKVWNQMLAWHRSAPAKSILKVAQSPKASQCHSSSLPVPDIDHPN